jgi:hypothetical protein
METWRMDASRIECSIIGCGRATRTPRNSNPRYRWIVDMLLKNEEDKEIRVNLCPTHVQSVFNLRKEDYAGLAKSETLVKETLQ